MGLLLLLLLLLILLAGPGLFLWVRTLTRGQWRHSPGWFAGSTVLLLLATGAVYLVGSLAGGLDPEEACHADGEPYDRAYRRAHFREYTRWFPLHDRCHAGHDLVPAWVNPALVVLPALALLCLAWAVRLAATHRHTEKDTP
ncbi:hypothetical protein ACFYY2_10775 [Streptomyces sp. NPDC001822]|uniref:hypothetical protein n=1 Tax=Streptomyces sp. NPDC001822 TaxID=3364614 RepID=UPI0036C00F74